MCSEIPQHFNKWVLLAFLYMFYGSSTDSPDINTKIYAHSAIKVWYRNGEGKPHSPPG